MYVCMHVCMYVWSLHIQSMYQPGKVANHARGQLNRENDNPLSPCVPKNLVSRDGVSRPVPRQPAHLHTQSGWIWCSLTGFLPSSAAASIYETAIRHRVSPELSSGIKWLGWQPDCAVMCVCVCFLPIHSGHQVRWTYQPGSHRRKVTPDF